MAGAGSVRRKYGRRLAPPARYREEIGEGGRKRGIDRRAGAKRMDQYIYSFLCLKNNLVVVTNIENAIDTLS